MPEPITLLDYANDREDVVVSWWTHVRPDVVEYPAGDPSWEEDGALDGLYQLTGRVAEDGSWAWDGVGSPTDGRGNTIASVFATVDAEAWAKLTDEDGG